MSCNKHTGRSQAVLLVAAMVLASGLAVTAGGKKPLPPPPEQARYTPVALGCDEALGLNNVGQVACSAYDADGMSRACLLTPADRDGDGDLDWFWDGNADGINDLLLNLGVLEGYGHSWANAVNDFGQVTGNCYYYGNTQRHRAFMWEDANGNGQSDPGEMIDLGTLGDDEGRWSRAYAINGDGQVVGQAASRAFLWEDVNHNGQSDPGEMIDLGTLGGPTSEAVSISDSGQVVGRADVPGGGSHAFVITPEDTNNNGIPDVWFRDAGDGLTNALMIDLGTLGGPESSAAAINDSGQIAGTAQVDANTGHAFLLTPESGPVWFRDDGAGGNALMTDLGVLKRTAASTSADLNSDAQVVGQSYKNPGSRNVVVKPFLWEDGQMKDLNELTDNFSYGAWPLRINNAGQILTSGHILLPMPAATQSTQPDTVDSDF